MRIHCRQIGFEVGRPEWDDLQEVIRYLHSARQVTFFTRDLGFFRRRLIHSAYCLVVLDVPLLETAPYIRRLLRHPSLKTRKNRLGKIIKVTAERITFWHAGNDRLVSLKWQ